MEQNDHQPAGAPSLLVSSVLSVFGATLIVVVLIYGRSFLLPIVTAFLVVNLLRAGSDHLQNLGLPATLATTIALTFLVLPLFGIGYILAEQADAVLRAWPSYVQRLEVITEQLVSWAGPVIVEKIKAALAEFNLSSRVPAVMGTAGGLLGNFALILLYVGFLLAGRGALTDRVDLMVTERERAEQIKRILRGIGAGIRQYLWIKTVMSFMTGVVSYIVLKSIEIDFAETWALLIFFLNYIPSIGSILGVVFPALLALVQFDTTWQFMVIAVALTIMQFLIGNVIEPMVMGRSLNLSPFVVIVSLAFWGMIWGVAGAFLSVPLTAAIVITLNNIPSCQWLAILMADNVRQWTNVTLSDDKT
jgi:AI-2 transport protein TqsA